LTAASVSWLITQPLPSFYSSRSLPS